MLVNKIYQKYLIPINLQEHMLRVTAVGDIICEHVKTVKVDRNLIIKTLLLHDMGNIIKYDFSRTELLAEEDKQRVKELKKNREEFIEKYGNDSDKATLAIMEELNLDKKIITLCENSHGEHSDQFTDSDDWERKIAYYCDMRIGLFGVKDLKSRFENLMKRNPNEKQKLKLYFQRCLKIEKQIQKVVNIDLQSINDEMIDKTMEDLKRTEI